MKKKAKPKKDTTRKPKKKPPVALKGRFIVTHGIPSWDAWQPYT